MNFDEWMERIDRVCSESYGLSIHDLPDMCFRDAFDDGMSPEDFMAEHLPDVDALGRMILS